MAEDLAVAAMLRKHARIAGEIDQLRKHLAAQIANLDHLEAAIHVMDPVTVIPHNNSVKHQQRHDNFRGEMSKFVLAFLRQQEGTATSRDIALEFMTVRGLSSANPKDVSEQQKRVGYSLTRLKHKGLIRQASTGSDGFRNWEIAR